MHRLLPVRPVYDPVRQLQCARTSDAPSQIPFENLVIDGREVAEDVAPQHVPETVAELFVARHGPMSSLADAVGVAVVDESAVEQRLAHGAPRVMDHPVAKWGRGDNSVFWIEYLDFPVTAGPIPARPQFPFEL